MAEGQVVHGHARETEPVLRCRSVSFTYSDGTRANIGIDLSLRAGEIFCLLGPNGAGKTTLIRQICAELRPTEGRVELWGRDAHADPQRTRAGLGIVPQSAALFEGLSVEEHLRLLGPIKGLDRRATAEACERQIEECGLEEVRKRRVRDLSGGQQRKVLLALALLADPPLLVLDEPSLGLDPEVRRGLWRTLETRRAEGRTIVLTTHSLDEAERLADRLGLMEAGRLVLVGTLDEMYARIGKGVRLAELDPETGALRAQHFFDSVGEAQAFARDRGLQAFSVGRVSLDDIYVRVLGHPLDAGAAP